jgi:hypothetical protein
MGQFGALIAAVVLASASAIAAPLDAAGRRTPARPVYVQSDDLNRSGEPECFNVQRHETDRYGDRGLYRERQCRDVHGDTYVVPGSRRAILDY